MQYLKEKHNISFNTWLSYAFVHKKLVQTFESLHSNGKNGNSPFADWLKERYPDSNIQQNILPEYPHGLEVVAAMQFGSQHPELKELYEKTLTTYFQSISDRAKPNLGYHMLARFLECWNPCLKVLTTNFDHIR